jgi:hypothetical protein
MSFLSTVFLAKFCDALYTCGILCCPPVFVYHRNRHRVRVQVIATKVSLAYDFDKNPGGFSFLLGGNIMVRHMKYNDATKPNILEGAVFVKAVFK